MAQEAPSHYTCPSPEFPGLTLSGELPPTSPLVPRSGASGAQVQPSACPLSLCRLPMHSASFPQCTSPGESMLPAVLRLLVYLGCTPAQLNLHLLPRAWVYLPPSPHGRGFYFTERKSRLTEVLHLCQAPQLKQRPHISSKIGAGEWLSG